MAAAAWLAGAWVAAAGAAPEGLEARLASDRRFYYEGEPIVVRLSLHNGAGSRATLERDLVAGLEILTADGERIGGAGATGPAAPRTLEPGGSHELPIDLSAVEELRRAGAYRIRWRSQRWAADPIEIRVIPRYDPQAAHAARIKTTDGEIAVRLMPEVAPLAVKVFVDLARAGFYDGARFLRVYPGSHVVSEPRPSAAAGTRLSFPGEQSDTPVLPGSVVFDPVGAAPPANGPAFIITVRPLPAWTAQVTVFGQVTHGLDVVERISRRPTGPDDPGRPLEPVAILKLSISAEPGPQAGP